MFDFRKIEKDDPLLNDVFRLRYKVYVEEWGFERAEDHPYGIEKDDYDKHSVHFVALRRDNGELIGTIRLILYAEGGFPIEKKCTIYEDVLASDRRHFGEISRLAVSKEYRKRAADRIIYDGQELSELDAETIQREKRKMENDIVAGLYRWIYLESMNIKVTHLYAVMARGLYLLLKRMGLEFVPVGPEVDYHGLRAPYLGSVEGIMEKLAKANPELYEGFTR